MEDSGPRGSPPGFPGGEGGSATGLPRHGTFFPPARRFFLLFGLPSATCQRPVRKKNSTEYNGIHEGSWHPLSHRSSSSSGQVTRCIAHCYPLHVRTHGSWAHDDGCRSANGDRCVTMMVNWTLKVHCYCYDYHYYHYYHCCYHHDNNNNDGTKTPHTGTRASRLPLLGG